MRLKRKKSDRVDGLTEKIKKSLPDLSPEDTVCAFAFNLDRDEAQKRRDGLFVADRERIRVFCDGEVSLDISVADVSEIKTDNGVGCIYISYVSRQDGSVNLICRSDMSASKRIIHVIKKFNHFLEVAEQFRAL